MTHAELAKHYLRYWEGRVPVSNAPRELWAWYQTMDASAVEHCFPIQALQAIASGVPAADPTVADALEWLTEADEHWNKVDELLAVPSKAPRSLRGLVVKAYKQALSEVVGDAHEFLTRQINK